MIAVYIILGILVAFVLAVIIPRALLRQLEDTDEGKKDEGQKDEGKEEG